MARQQQQTFLIALMALSVTVLVQGCLIVRVAEHRIRINDNGSGEATMRLIDIRSDAATDSARIHDFGVMMASVETEGVKDFEQNGRKVTAKQFFVNGDTLSAEISYTFPAIDQVEGFKSRGDEIYVVVNEGREIVRTNGKIKSWERNAQRIVWPKDARRLIYQIREKAVPRTTSLAALYERYTRRGGGGNR
jgi:hypothetical protein